MKGGGGWPVQISACPWENSICYMHTAWLDRSDVLKRMHFAVIGRNRPACLAPRNASTRSHGSFLHSPFLLPLLPPPPKYAMVFSPRESPGLICTAVHCGKIKGKRRATPSQSLPPPGLHRIISHTFTIQGLISSATASHNELFQLASLVDRFLRFESEGLRYK